MIQLINSLPFDSSCVTELKNEWTRFQEGKVIFSQIPDAICDEFICEAEIIPQLEEEIVEEEEFDANGEIEESTKFNELLNNLPSGKGKLILSAR